MTWTIKKLIDEVKEKETQANRKGPAYTLSLEVDRLSKLRCPYCSGYGHFDRDCPTDVRLRDLGAKNSHQSRLMRATRKQALELTSKENPPVSSPLGASPNTLGKRKRRSSDLDLGPNFSPRLLKSQKFD